MFWKITWGADGWMGRKGATQEVGRPAGRQWVVGLLKKEKQHLLRD